VPIRKRSEHGLGHLLNPLDPDRDDRDWITLAWNLILNDPWLLVEGGGPHWLNFPALTRIALTTKEVARAFSDYNDGRPPHEQIRPFNFLLHAHHSFSSEPEGTKVKRFRLVAPYESNPERWLGLPWVDLSTGERHPVTTVGIPSPEVVLLKTYREVLARYAIHPEPKSLDPDGRPCSRRSQPGLLRRRPITMLMVSLIGKESNRLDEIAAGLIGDLDDTLTSYADPGLSAWEALVVPALEDFSSGDVASRAGLDTRTVQRIKRRAITKSRDQNRALLTLIVGSLVEEQIERWGDVPPSSPLGCIAYYIDCREDRRQIHRCEECGVELGISRQRYCSVACKKRAYRTRRRHLQEGGS
jgi:hypothetical protein